MGLYSRFVLPRLIETAMRGPAINEIRQRTLARAYGRVLEVGIGSALNLRYYPSTVSQVIGVDPSEQLAVLARRRMAESKIPVELHTQSGEALPVANRSIDCAVFTWTLCSIPDVYQALRELRRVLKPGAKILFAEHGLSPDRDVQRWQHRVQPLWAPLTGGCHLTRKVDDLLKSSGFVIDECNGHYIEGPKIAAYMYEGSAHWAG